jgi:hypothetical protein
MLPFSVRDDELVRAMLAAETVEPPPIVAVPLTVMAPLNVAPSLNVAVVPEAIVSEAAVIEQVVLDVKVEFVFMLMALDPVTEPGPLKLSVAVLDVPTLILPVTLNDRPDGKVSVTVAPFATLIWKIDPPGRVDGNVMLAFELICAMSLFNVLPGYNSTWVNPNTFQFPGVDQLPEDPPCHT